ELDERAERLAACLRLLGARPERVVGVCLGRSVHLVVALLAVLKSGSAYLPLDPAYPAERLNLMLEDAGAFLLIGDATATARWRGRVRILELDRDGAWTDPDETREWSSPSAPGGVDRKSTRLNSSHVKISYAVFCLKRNRNPALRGLHVLHVRALSVRPRVEPGDDNVLVSARSDAARLVAVGPRAAEASPEPRGLGL